MANIMFTQLDHILKEERLEAERIAAIRRQEWLVRFAGMMAGKLKQQKEEEAVTINYNNTVTIDGVSYGILDIPDDIWVEMDWDYRIPIMFMQMDHYLERERLEEERRAGLRKQEWMIRFAEMMTAKLKQQKEDEDKTGKGKGEAGPSGI
ncbi:hypothetical protein ACET3Z_026259 [Daucus carota]